MNFFENYGIILDIRKWRFFDDRVVKEQSEKSDEFSEQQQKDMVKILKDDNFFGVEDIMERLLDEFIVLEICQENIFD